MIATRRTINLQFRPERIMTNHAFMLNQATGKANHKSMAMAVGIKKPHPTDKTNSTRCLPKFPNAHLLGADGTRNITKNP